MEIKAGDYVFVPLDDPASRFTFDGSAFAAVPGYENHPMTNVSWFGAWGYCGAQGARLPPELEWEKAARGADDRPFPWGFEIARNNANFYASRDPFEDMGSFGSRTSPVGFYNGRSYDGYRHTSIRPARTVCTIWPATSGSESPIIFKATGAVAAHFLPARRARRTRMMDVSWLYLGCATTPRLPIRPGRWPSLRARAACSSGSCSPEGADDRSSSGIQAKARLYWPLTKSLQTGLLLLLLYPPAWPAT